MIPRYNKLAEEIERDISENYRPGDSYKSVRNLMASYGVSLQTVNKAFSIVEEKGLITKIQGKGTFVCDPFTRTNGEFSGPSLYIVTQRGGIDMVGNPYYADIYKGIQHAVYDRHVRLGFGSYCTDIGHVVMGEGYDAILFISPLTEHMKLVDQCSELSLPTIVVGSHWPDMSTCCIDTDMAESMRSCLDILYSKGHRRVGYVGRSAKNMIHENERFDEFMSYASKLKMEVRPEWIIAREQVSLGKVTANAISKAISGNERPTSFVFSSYYYLVPDLVRTVKQLSRQTPDSITFIGFDDPEWVAFVDTPLITIRQDLFSIGEKAARNLLDRIDGNNVFRQIEYVPVTITERGYGMEAKTNPEVLLNA